MYSFVIGKHVSYEPSTGLNYKTHSMIYDMHGLAYLANEDSGFHKYSKCIDGLVCHSTCNLLPILGHMGFLVTNYLL